MPYVCYVHDPRAPVPYMEVLAEISLEEAAAAARRLLRERPEAETAELWQEDDLIRTLARA